MVQIRQKRPYTISLKFKHIASNPWMRMLLQGKVPYDDLLGMFDKDLEADDISILVDCILNRPLRYRNRAMAVLSHLADNDIQSVAAFLFVHPKTVGRYIKRFRSGGVRSLLDYPGSKAKKADIPENKQAVFAVLHSPPMTHGIKRTTWRIKDLQNVPQTGRKQDMGQRTGRTGVQGKQQLQRSEVWTLIPWYR